jgi:hypothetical protein
VNITADKVKQLRDKTGAGMMDCKTALHEASGDLEEAATILRKKGIASASKKAGRILLQEQKSFKTLLTMLLSRLRQWIRDFVHEKMCLRIF